MSFIRLGDIDFCYNTEGSGPRLLKIWGTGGDLRRLPTEFDRRLADRFTVLAFDQRGMGRSGKPARDYTMADYADDAAGLMDALGWDSAAVLGYSFGGMVAQELALRHTLRVTRLVLMSTSAGGAGGSSHPMHELAALDDATRVRRFLELADTRRTPQWQAEHPALWQGMVDDGLAALHLADEDPAAREGARRQMEARRHHDTWQRLPALALPVSVFAGRHDAIAAPEVQRRMAQRIAGAAHREFEGGHLFFVQDPAATPAIVEALGG
ncbi:alpha/beta hydrolase [Sulfuritalea sp.]|uniref:alpha/beta fold hydrolase n=1 Tax=Sulfuritalea sp. TaxID=2480090 RepID=UPI001AD1A79E|nr:alpha/beta hydrolase [Sulfuritalea sp.]MBN8476613.1 alpha/beta fold hydrolase [Sulfuritalea sp.]